MIKNLKLKQAGFTILESIVAIFILSMSISGVFSAVQQSLYQAAIAKDEVKAFYLAQEAIEVIRNKRDTNQLIKVINDPSNSWLKGISQIGLDTCPFGGACTVDATNFQIVSCGTSRRRSCDENLRQDPITLRYGYDSTWPAIGFKREIQIELVRSDEYGNPVEIAVNVRISWADRELIVKTYLFNWI